LRPPLPRRTRHPQPAPRPGLRRSRPHRRGTTPAPGLTERLERQRVERRRYESLRRQSQADRTRSDIAAAAARLFTTKGWAATSVRDVAEAAGVSVPTVYSAYGNKTGLVWALVNAADLAADQPQQLAELEDRADPAGQLAAMAGYDRRLFERAGNLIELVRAAGRPEPDAADR